MNIIKGLLLIMLFPAVVFAQKTAADSMYIYSQSARELSFITESGTQLLSSPIQKLSTASLRYLTANGHLRTAQQAEHSSTYVFQTSGVSTLDRFKIYGRFKFSRSWQDSLSWTMQGLPNIAEPYYYAAGKAGKYQRINYDLGGLITYKLPGEHFSIATGIDYLYNTASRSVDPRPSIQTFQLGLSPELIYQLNKQTFGFGLRYGYEHENNTISYKNDDFNKGLSYPDRVNYLMMGYGYNTIIGTSKLKRKSNFKGLSGSYAFIDSTRYLRSHISYETQHENNYFPLNNSANDRLFGTFELNTYRFSLLTGQNTSRFNQQLYVDVRYQKGNDRNIELGGTNYRYSGYSGILNYKILPKGLKSINFEYGINTLVYNLYQKDISTAHLMDITYVEPGIALNAYKRYANSDRFKLGISPAVRLPMAQSLTVPLAQENVFTYNIAYPAYTYYNSTVGRLLLDMEYTTLHFMKGVNSGFSINGTFNKALSNGYVYPGSTFIPSKSFLELAFSFNLYF